jgi:hypothetical protein
MPIKAPSLRLAWVVPFINRRSSPINALSPNGDDVELGVAKCGLENGGG